MMTFLGAEPKMRLSSLSLRLWPITKSWPAETAVLGKSPSMVCYSRPDTSGGFFRDHVALIWRRGTQLKP